MNVIGVLVHAIPYEETAITAALAMLPGVEIHTRSNDGRLVVTATDTEGLLASEALMKMAGIPGVLSAALVYHAVDDGADDDEIPCTCGGAPGSTCAH